MKAIAIITARSGSKGFPNKNIAQVGGKSLVELAAIQGRDAALIDDVYISTDSQTYAAQAIACGASFQGLRSAALSSDTAKSIDVVIDLLDKLPVRYDYAVILQPTSPMRSPQDIDAAMKLLLDAPATVDAVLAVEPLDEPHPIKVKKIADDGYLGPYIAGADSMVPRQSLPKAYKSNGAIYACKTSIIYEQRTMLPARTLPYIMPKTVNIDGEEDYILMKAMYERGRFEIYGAQRDA